VKGGIKLGSLEPDSSPENLRRSVTAINDALDGAKRLDLFEAARVDPAVPIEDAISTLKGLIKEGLFDYIGVSEVKAETLARANKVHPIAAVEIEVSLWSYEDETKKGRPHHIVMLAYPY
jgi:pyridoxine 4-dehydrogenase